MTGHDELFAHTESVLSRLGGVDPSLFDSHQRLGSAVEIMRSGSRKSRHQRETIEALLEALDDDEEEALRRALLEGAPGPRSVVLKPAVRSWMVKPTVRYGSPADVTWSMISREAGRDFGESLLEGLVTKIPLPDRHVSSHESQPVRKSKAKKPGKQAEAAPGDADAAGTPRAGASAEAVVSAVLEATVTGTPAVNTPVGVVVDFGIPDPDDATEQGEFSVTFPPGKNRLPMVVQLTSTDIDIDAAAGQQPLVMKRDGTSEQPATFKVVPRTEGSAHLTATLLRMGSVVAQVAFTVDVVASAEDEGPELTPLIPASSIGRALDALQIDSSRFLSLTFLYKNGKFQCVVSGEVGMEAELDISREELNAAVLQLRDVLVGLSHDDAYQGSIHIDKKPSSEALTNLAKAGSLLFHSLFYLRPENTQAAAIGDLLIDRLGVPAPSRPIQFVVGGHAVPWHALYLARTFKGTPDKDRFLGFRHVIEELVVNLPRYDAPIPVDKGLSVALHFDPNIDEEQNLDAVKNQRRFWADAVGCSPGIEVQDRTKNSELLKSIGSGSRYQVIYFLCHAGAGKSSEGQPLPNASWLQLTEEPVTVGDLTLFADARIKLKKNPFVFVNACRSAELSPQYTVNFPNYFLDRGARTVIGTECEIATHFADEFARRLFTAVLSGVPVGVAMLDLRREMIDDGNALGLAYGLHGASDTYLAPALLTA
ncbi:CHAT domain-containing protein [Microbacterium sp. LWH7-1.2]|uniref:CHAT domain-containing protein n=1 Tax=Microbacterium sp. LWH7-1.2 TaxID=3135257 RepID=UPI003139FFB6